MRSEVSAIYDNRFTSRFGPVASGGGNDELAHMQQHKSRFRQLCCYRKIAPFERFARPRIIKLEAQFL